MAISLKNYILPYFIAIFFIFILIGVTSFMNRGEEGAEITGAASVPDNEPMEEHKEANQSIELVEENNSVETGNSS